MDLSHEKSKGKEIVQVIYNSRTSSTTIKHNIVVQSLRRRDREQTIEKGISPIPDMGNLFKEGEIIFA